MIRVLHIVTVMNCGGLETMIMNYYRNIDRTKIQFDFLVHRYESGAYDNEIENLGGRIFRLPYLNPFSKNYKKSLDTFFKNKKDDYKIVHCHLDCMSSIPLKYAKKYGINVRIAHSHSSSQDKNIKYFVKLYYKNKIHKYANNLFACGDKAGRWMFGNKKFIVLNNAIDSKSYSFNQEKRSELRKHCNITQNTFIIGHVGRFSPVKNHKFIVDIFFEILNINKNARLILVGSGNEESAIKEYVDRKQINDNVMFLGTRNDVNEIMQVFDVLLFPSLYEGLPLTLVEAQASGLLCFISDNISKQCIITNNVRTISLKCAAKEWATIILKESSEFEREDTYSQIVKAGFDIKDNAKKLEEFYINEYNKI